MAGETHLSTLLQTLRPELMEGEFVFCTVDSRTAPIHDPVMTFQEKEGTTLILTRSAADRLGLSYAYVAAWITLTVHSSLEAVGLTAAFSKALADQRISCNVVAGYYHDHLFVDKKDASKAMEILRGLS
jgi:hypothetical protein